MTLIKICMLAVMGIAVTMVVKQWKADFLPLVRLGFLLLFGTLILSAVTPLIELIRSLSETNGSSEFAEILFKALGIAVLTQFASQICRECGETGIASGVELIGTVELLLLSLPFINQILTTVQELLTTGG